MELLVSSVLSHVSVTAIMSTFFVSFRPDLFLIDLFYLLLRRHPVKLLETIYVHCKCKQKICNSPGGRYNDLKLFIIIPKIRFSFKRVAKSKTFLSSISTFYVIIQIMYYKINLNLYKIDFCDLTI